MPFHKKENSYILSKVYNSFNKKCFSICNFDKTTRIGWFKLGRMMDMASSENTGRRTAWRQQNIVGALYEPALLRMRLPFELAKNISGTFRMMKIRNRGGVAASRLSECRIKKLYCYYLKFK